MVDEPRPENEGEEPEEQLPQNYEAAVTEEAERPMSLDGLGASASEAEPEEDRIHKTDIQTIVDKLVPRFGDKRRDQLLGPVMMSRIFPDNYTDLIFLHASALMEECENGFPDVIGILSNVQVAASIAFEGRHIVDLLEIAGVVHQEEMERIGKELGLGG